MYSFSDIVIGSVGEGLQEKILHFIHNDKSV